MTQVFRELALHYDWKGQNTSQEPYSLSQPCLCALASPETSPSKPSPQLNPRGYPTCASTWALDHYPLGPGETILWCSDQAAEWETPSQIAWFWATGKQIFDCRCSGLRVGIAKSYPGFKGGCFWKPCGQLNSSYLAFFFPQLLAEMEDFLASVLIPTVLRASVPLHILPRLPFPSSVVPCTIWKLYAMANNTFYHQLHHLIEAWPSPWTHHISYNCSFLHVMHKLRGGELGHQALPQRRFQIVTPLP